MLFLAASLLLLALEANGASARTIWSVSGPATLIEASERYLAGDVIELEPGDYLLRSKVAGAPVLLFERPVVVRSRDPSQRAVLRGYGASVLLAAVSSGVELRDLIVGRQASGADSRAIDLFVAAGTQTQPTNKLQAYGVGVADLAVEHDKLDAALDDGSTNDGSLLLKQDERQQLRAIGGLVIDNVDFSRSLAGTNVAFGAGAYAGVSIERSWFAADVAAIVATRTARFDGATLAVHRNVFARGARVAFGGQSAADVSLAALGRNRWLDETPSLRFGASAVAPDTLCLDLECSQFGPIVDADAPERAFGTLGDAVASGVERIRITGRVVIDSHVELSGKSGAVTIDGGETCSEQGAAAPLLVVRGPLGAIGSSGALAGARNLRVQLEGAGARAFVFEGGAAESSVVLFDGVSVVGDDSGAQVAFDVSAAAAQLELRDTLVVAAARGVSLQSGSVSLVDTTFVGSSDAAVAVAAEVRGETALRVAGSTFVASAVGIRLGERGGAALMRELRVECSSFLFNAQLAPVVSHECVGRPTLCSAGVRHNTVISATGDQTGAEARALRQGANHIELGREFEQYVYAGEPRHFSLRDDQGRLSWASGALLEQSAAAAEFLVATYAPLRSECLAAGESVDVGSAEAAVVSDVLELRADSLLHQCGGVGVRFRIADAETLPTSADLAVYGVAGVGTSRVAWERAATAETLDQSGAVVLEATLRTNDAAQRHQHRIVVVSHALLPEAVAEALDSGAALVGDAVLNRAAGRSLCVACGGVAVPGNALDRLCGGSTANVRQSLEAAYDELGFGAQSGAPRQEPASIVVFGRCEMALDRCTIKLDQNEHIEGGDSDATIVRQEAASCNGEPLLLFRERASKSSVRGVTLLGHKVGYGGVCAVEVARSTAQLGPTVTQCSIDGGVCINARSGGKYINNEVRGSFFVEPIDETQVKMQAPVLIEANLISNGCVAVTAKRASFLDDDDDGAGVEEGGGEKSAPKIGEIRITRNTFRRLKARGGYADIGVEKGVPTGVVVLLGTSDTTAVHVVGNRDLSELVLDAIGAKIAATQNTFALEGAHIVLNSKGSAIDGGNGQAPQALPDTEQTIVLVSSGELRNVRIGKLARLFTAARELRDPIPANAVLTNVEFVDFVASVNVDRRNFACKGIELDVSGIDLQKSTVYDVSGSERHQLFTPFEVALFSQVDASTGQTFWSAAAKQLRRCTVQREPGWCGCAPIGGATGADSSRPAVAVAQGNVAWSGKSQADNAAGVVRAESDSSSGNTLFIVLGVGGGLLLICVLIAICLAISRRSADAAQSDLRRRAGRRSSGIASSLSVSSTGARPSPNHQQQQQQSAGRQQTSLLNRLSAGSATQQRKSIKNTE